MSDPADRTSAVDRTISTTIGPLHVRVVGCGPPAVLWHSLFVDSTTWRRVEGVLAAERRLVMVDAPGHGGSPDPGRDFTLEDCVDAALDVLESLGIDGPVDWLGNAWGGHVGTILAATRPDRCRSLVTVGTPVHALESDIARKMRASIPVYRAFGPVGFLVRGYCGALVDLEHDDPADVRLVTDAFRRADRRGLARTMRCLSLRRVDQTPLLDRISAPTLIVTGAGDEMWRPDQALVAVQHLAHGAVVVLPGSGHVAPLLRSAGPLADLVLRFWRDPTATVTSLRSEQAPSRN